jgi:hypothetical protein
MFNSCGVTDIVRLRTSMRPSRWNSLITLETASLVETIMFARSWWVRRTLRPCPTRGLPEAVAQVREQRGQARRNLPVQEALYHLVDCLRRSEKEENSFRANSDGVYHLGQDGFAYHGHADAGECFGEGALPGPLVESQLAEHTPVLRSPTVASLCTRRRSCTGAPCLEKKVELPVGIPRGEERVFCRVAPLRHSDAFP